MNLMIFLYIVNNVAKVHQQKYSQELGMQLVERIERSVLHGKQAVENVDE